MIFAPIWIKITLGSGDTKLSLWVQPSRPANLKIRPVLGREANLKIRTVLPVLGRYLHQSVCPLWTPFPNHSFTERAFLWAYAHFTELGLEYRTVARVVVFIVDSTERRIQKILGAGRKKLPSRNGKTKSPPPKAHFRRI